MVVILQELGVLIAIAAQGLCTYIFIIAQSSVATSLPHRSSVEPMHNGDDVGSVLALSLLCRGLRPKSLLCSLGPTSLLSVGVLDHILMVVHQLCGHIIAMQ